MSAVAPAVSVSSAESTPGAGEELLANLTRLAQRLRAQGFEVTSDRWTNVMDLIASLAFHQRLPDDPAGLGPYLAPLLCRSSFEQAAFDEVFEAWLDDAAVSSPVVVQMRRAQHAEAERAASTPEKPAPRSRGAFFFIVTLVLLGLLAAGLYYATKPEPVILPGEPPIEPPTETRTTEPSPSNTDSGDDTWRQLPLEPIPPRTPLESPSLNADNLARLVVLDRLVVAVFPIIVLALLAWRWWRRRIVLRRRRGSPDDPLASLSLAGRHDDLFAGQPVREGLRRLHNPVPRSSRRMDVTASVARTVEQGGLIQLVNEVRQAVPEVVVLVDRADTGDQLSGLSGLVAKRLEEEGLVVHHYLLAGEPRLAHRPAASHGAPIPPVDLATLALRHRGARLVLVGDPAALIDTWRRELTSWATALEDWSERGLLATRTLSREWENIVEASGFVVAPLSSDGIRRLSERLAGAPVSGAAPVANPLPALLQEDAPWLRPVSPGEEQVKALCQQLTVYLGGRGYLLLAAMAVYPGLHWGLTRALDLSLFPEGTERDRRMLGIARLPWSREGWLPDWLRKVLVGSLSQRQRKRLAVIYRELFRRSAEAGEARIDLPVSVPPSPGTSWQRFWSGLRQRFRREQRGWGRYLADLIRFSPASSLARDRIFAELILGGKLQILDFELDRALSRYLPGWRWLGAAAPVVAWLAIGLLAAAGLSYAWTHQLRDVSAERLLAQQGKANAAYPVTVFLGPGAEPMAQSLSATLRAHGFTQIVQQPWPTFTDRGGTPRLSGGPAARRRTPLPPVPRYRPRWRQYSRRGLLISPIGLLPTVCSRPPRHRRRETLRCGCAGRRSAGCSAAFAIR